MQGDWNVCSGNCGNVAQWGDLCDQCSQRAKENERALPELRAAQERSRLLEHQDRENVRVFAATARVAGRLAEAEEAERAVELRWMRYA